MWRLAAALALVAGWVSPAPAARFTAQASDFRCLRDMAKATGHEVFVFNRNPRRLRKALRTIERNKPQKRYPVGTILQLVPFEAMVKVGGHANPTGNDWAFCTLTPTVQGTTDLTCGGAEVVNRFNHTSCQGCHQAARAFDFVCDTDHGCGALGVPDSLIEALQATDPRCAPAR